MPVLKRLGRIWDKVVSMDNLRMAHRRASEDKSYYKDVRMVNSNPEYYLGLIRDMLINHTYEVGEYTEQEINDKGKRRKLMKLKYFPDRIIQWAIMLQIEDTLVSTMCTHVCASIPKRGSKRVNILMEEYLSDEEGSRYTYKFDIKQFYPSIDHDILKRKIRRKIKDVNVLWLLDVIIDSYPGGKGLPIGSYLSQYLANFYLSDFDHWLKEELHLGKVVRYMDDVVIMAESKERLHDVHRRASEYLKDNLDLEIKGNWQVFPTNVRGVDFVGYRHFNGYRLLRKKTAKRMKALCLTVWDKQLRGKRMNYREWCGVNSYVGWLIWCDSWRLYERYVELVKPSVLKYYKETICHKHHGSSPEAEIKSFNKYADKFNRKKGRCAA